MAAEVTDTSKTFTLALNNGEAITNVGILNQPIPTSANRTCIAIIDEVSRTATEIRNSWLAFKSNYPDRTFYLLQPGGPSRGDLKEPAEFTADPAAFGPITVNRDNGSVSNASDWYTICNLNQLPDGSEIAMFIDVSGSMTLRTVQASYNLLVSKLNARNMTIISVSNTQENWIAPFDQIL